MFVSPIYTSHELEYMVKDSGVRTIICHDTNYGYVREILPKTPIEHVIVTNLLDLLSWHKRSIAMLFDKAPHGKVNGGAETLTFKSLLRNGSQHLKWKSTPSKISPIFCIRGARRAFLKECPATIGGTLPTSTTLATMFSHVMSSLGKMCISQSTLCSTLWPWV